MSSQHVVYIGCDEDAEVPELEEDVFKVIETEPTKASEKKSTTKKTPPKPSTAKKTPTSNKVQNGDAAASE